MKKIKNKRYCTSHECNDCGQRLKVDSWVPAVTFFIAMGLFMLLMFGMNTGIGIYSDRCWIQEDEIGIDTKSGEVAIKQFPIKCSQFESLNQ